MFKMKLNRVEEETEETKQVETERIYQSVNPISMCELCWGTA